MTNRGTCTKCGRVMQVRADGLIRTHRDPADNRCIGGGQPPVGAQQDNERHDEIAKLTFRTILVCREEGITDPLRTAHAIAVALKLAEESV